MAQQRQEGLRAEGLLRFHCCECVGKLTVPQHGSATKNMKTIVANKVSADAAELFQRVTVRFRETDC